MEKRSDPLAHPLQFKYWDWNCSACRGDLPGCTSEKEARAILSERQAQKATAPAVAGKATLEQLFENSRQVKCVNCL
jgi:hypothetical protein